MIAIDNILVSDAVVKEQFVCDLGKCKGACCVDGDAGAPLEKDELDKINEVYEAVLPYLNTESKRELQRQGRYVYDKEYGWVTPTIESKVCVYGIKDAAGIVKCGIEQAYMDGKIKWKKPISCHLFPVIVKNSKRSDDVYVNYEPREDNCKAACAFGKKLKVPVYVFLKEALLRKFGQKFYDALEVTAKHVEKKPDQTFNIKMKPETQSPLANCQLPTANLLFACCLLLLTSCSVNKANNDESLKKYFDENKVEGCFTMFNNADGEVTVYNMKYDTMRFSPASTFKIFNSLVGLQTGRITDEHMVIKWDGIERRNKDWNKDMDMTEAFKVSCVPFYQEVARRIGRDTMQQWIDSIGYGNKNISGPIDSFWLNGKLKISPDEQLGFVKKLYFDQRPFRKSVQQQVRDVMLQESNTAYQLSYKTGWGFDDEGKDIGWLVGWIEENKHVYFFVTFVKAPDHNTDMKSVRMNITKSILKQYGFFEGKK